MKILLVYPYTRKEVIDYGVEAWISEPLALEYLAAGAKKDSHEVKILDLRLFPDALDATLSQYQPDLVAVTGYSLHVLTVQSLCRRIKELNPICTTVVGGHHATVLPEDFFEPAIDFVVMGEGVAPFQEILRRLDLNEKEPAGIPGVWSQVRGEFKEGPSRYLYEIDSLPFPDREVNLKDRPAYFMDDMRPIALMRTTEGCAFKCSFCSLWTIMDSKYLVRENARVIEELHQIKENFVHIIDDEPWLKIDRMFRLAADIKAEGIKKEYLSYCRVDTMARRPELMASWREAGLRTVLMGIEAFTERELVEYNKRVGPHQIDTAIEVARDLDIKIIALLIINPNYQPKDFKRLGRFIERLNIQSGGISILTPLPGTEALSSFDVVTERQPNGRPNWELFDLQHPVTKTALPRDEFIREFLEFRKTFGENYFQLRMESLALALAQ